MATPYLTIPHMAHSELHETCMFHTTRKCGPHKHAMGMHCGFFVVPPMDMCVTVKL